MWNELVFVQSDFVFFHWKDFLWQKGKGHFIASGHYHCITWSHVTFACKRRLVYSFGSNRQIMFYKPLKTTPSLTKWSISFLIWISPERIRFGRLSFVMGCCEKQRCLGFSWYSSWSNILFNLFSWRLQTKPNGRNRNIKALKRRIEPISFGKPFKPTRLETHVPRLVDR